MITLGQDHYLPGASPRETTSAPVPAQTSVNVQNVIVMPQPVYGYGLYAPGAYRTYTAAPVRAVAPATGVPPVAGDWPAPPDYGPRMGR